MEDNGYEKARNLQQKPNRLLATILISNNFVNVAIVVLSTYLVNSLFDFSAYPTLGFIIQVIVVTFVILLAGEIIPKLYANRSQLSMVIFMAGPLTFLSHLFRPLSALLIGSTSIISKRMDKKDNLSIDQLSKALELTKDTAINEEKDILEGIVRFGNIDAVDIIRPRINVIAIDGSSSYQQVKEIITEHGYSRMPVYEENLDNITGILYVKDLLQHLDEKEDFRWQTLIRPALSRKPKRSTTYWKSSKRKRYTWRLLLTNTGEPPESSRWKTLSKRSWATLMMNTTNRKLFTRGTRMGHTFSRPPRY